MFEFYSIRKGSLNRKLSRKIFLFSSYLVGKQVKEFVLHSQDTTRREQSSNARFFRIFLRFFRARHLSCIIRFFSVFVLQCKTMSCRSVLHLSCSKKSFVVHLSCSKKSFVVHLSCSLERKILCQIILLFV